MIELHGWMTISPTYKNEDLHTDIQEYKIIQDVKDYIKKLKYNTIDRLRVRCGTYYIVADYYSNHKNEEVEEIICAFKTIAEIATGSYGVVYYMNDDDKKNYNDFMTMIIKRGTTDWKRDELLSPFMPTVHDEYL